MTGHMRATYTTAVRYQAEAICRTPLRTAGAGGELDLVLKSGSFGSEAFLEKAIEAVRGPEER